MAGSIGVAVRTAVINDLSTYLAAQAAFNGTTNPERKVEVTYGYTFNGHASEQVYTGRSRADHTPAAMKAGRNFRNEAGQFEVNILVRYVGGNASDADTRAFAILAEIEQRIADRKSNEYGVTGLIHIEADGWEADYMGVDQGVGSLVTLRVNWSARLT